MEYKFDLDDIELTLFELLDLGPLQAISRFSGQTVEEYRAIVRQAAHFARREVAALNERGDRTGAHLEDGRVRMPEGFRETWRRLGEMGLTAMDLSPEHGGLGLPSAVATAVAELVSGACPSLSAFHLLTHGVGRMVETFGSEALKRQHLPRLASGEETGTMCLTEPHAGSAVGDLRTAATLQPDGSYLIQGTKIFISGGGHDMAEDILHLVLARVVGDAPGTQGISLFAVPSRDNDVKVVSLERKMGIHASPTCQMAFGEQGKCRGELLGQRSQGMRCMFQMMNAARLAVGQQGVATGGAAYEHALAYARERTQGGGTLIIEYPDVRRALMTMKAYVEGLRILVQEAALFVDLQEHHPDAAVREGHEGMLGVMTPVLKAFGSDMGFKVTELAMQVFGGAGYTQDVPVEQYMRDLKAASLYEGTNGIQAMDLVGRKFLRNRGEHLNRYRARLAASLEQAAKEAEAAPLAEKVHGALERFADAARVLASRAGEDGKWAGLAATPFLRALGEIMVGEALVRRAAFAARKLREGAEAKERARMLQGKIEVARFHVAQLLPQADAELARVTSEDRSALADVL
ncbi:MAG TPA: acyl-CoA dehydrogenase [Myxococcales bacterium]|nr:acyl-CoA dehydrogenase [Myxococcales bacterium]